jgi:uncharacterized radical SAM superfamily protein
MKKILLLNPPSQKLCVRDYYCSFSSKTDYCWPPQDLVALSGTLGSEYEVDYLDPRAHGYDFDKSLAVAARGCYEAVVFTTGSVNLPADLEFIRLLKERCPGIRAIASGSIFLFIGKELMEKFPFIDAALLDFTNRDILHFLSGGYGRIAKMFYRMDGKLVLRRGDPGDGQFSFPVPLHSLFDCKHYRFPFFVFGSRRFVTTIASLGCPFKCSFCVASRIRYRRRETENLMQELSYLYKNSSVRNIFFADCSFTEGRQRLTEICARMHKDYRSAFGWICNSRAEPLLEMDTVKALKRSGCRMVMLGAESGDQRILDRYGKNLSVGQVKEAAANCRQAGLRTLLYFVLGLPGEDNESLRNTADFISGLPCDFISISFAVPDFGTDLREESLRQGWCKDEMGGWDHSGGQYISGDWAQGQLENARNDIYRNFYLNPRWLLRRAGDLGGLRFADIREGAEILKSWL